MKTILAAVDSSGMSELVVAEAAALAGSTGGRVVVVTVVQLPIITPEYYAFVPENIAEISAAGEAAAGEHLAKLKGRGEREGVRIETVQITGAPVPGILEQAGKWSADYIVMGSHGHTAFYDLLVGSTTHGVLLRASCPVVIVPSKNKKRE